MILEKLLDYNSLHETIKKAADEIRTHDLVLTKDALYRLSYSSLSFDGKQNRQLDDHPLSGPAVRYNRRDKRRISHREPRRKTAAPGRP